MNTQEIIHNAFIDELSKTAGIKDLMKYWKNKFVAKAAKPKLFIGKNPLKNADQYMSGKKGE